ncbi:MAG TPA: LacI family DNA-binding transcriptional regulator [Naasia sp.]
MSGNGNGAARRPTVTIKHVAELAGVSLGSVSMALNHPDRVTPEMRARVLKAVDELGFVRNSAARSLAAGTSNTVGFVLIDLENSYFVDMARGAEAAAQDAGMFVVLANSDIQASKQDNYLNLFEQERVSGVLLAPVAGRLDGMDRTRERGIPVVVLDTMPDMRGCCSVSTNYELAGYLAARHLLELGRRRLAFAGGPLTYRAVADRKAGAERAVREVGGTLEYLESSELQAPDGREVGYRIAARDAAERPDGIVAAADLLALGILQALLTASALRIPEDVALVACDDNKAAHDSIIPVSTVSLPGFEVGQAGTQLLLEEIQSPETHTHRSVVLEPSLVARESTIGRLRQTALPPQARA